MGWNGSGTVTRSNGTHSGTTTWAQDAAAGTNIEASIHDTHDQDLATAIQNCLAKDGQNAATANLNIGGFRLGNVGSGTSRTDAITTAQVQDSSVLWGGTSTGSANVQAISLTPSITAYATGQRYAFKAGYTNTGGTTLNINGIGAISIKHKGNTLVGNEIIANAIHTVYYDGTDFQLETSSVVPGFWVRNTSAPSSPAQGIAHYALSDKLRAKDPSGNILFERTTFTPANPTINGAMRTFTGGSKSGYYVLIGDMIFFEMSFENWTHGGSGAGGTEITCTLPKTQAGLNRNGFSASCYNNSLWISTCARTEGSTSVIITKYDNSTFATTATYLTVSGCYFWL